MQKKSDTETFPVRFGAEGQLRKDSDIDFLVEFQPSEAPSLLDLARMERDLSTLLDDRKVDLRTPNELSRYFRGEVLYGQCSICGRTLSLK